MDGAVTRCIRRQTLITEVNRDVRPLSFVRVKGIATAAVAATERPRLRN